MTEKKKENNIDWNQGQDKATYRKYKKKETTKNEADWNAQRPNIVVLLTSQKLRTSAIWIVQKLDFLCWNSVHS